MITNKAWLVSASKVPTIAIPKARRARAKATAIIITDNFPAKSIFPIISFSLKKSRAERFCTLPVLSSIISKLKSGLALTALVSPFLNFPRSIGASVTGSASPLETIVSRVISSFPISLFLLQVSVSTKNATVPAAIACGTGASVVFLFLLPGVFNLDSFFSLTHQSHQWSFSLQQAPG